MSRGVAYCTTIWLVVLLRVIRNPEINPEVADVTSTTDDVFLSLFPGLLERRSDPPKGASKSVKETRLRSG